MAIFLLHEMCSRYKGIEAKTRFNDEKYSDSKIK